MKQFDLNIEKILEDWETYHALREIIANALDEQILSDTRDIDIYKVAGEWHIRDYGRGITYNHLTQNENPEKLKNPTVIGKFGIGLKDALATFDRKGIKVTLRSKHGDITLSKAAKEGFSDIVTLHAQIAPPTDPTLAGTDVVVNGCTEDDVDTAKKLFIRFSGESVLESTKYGDVVSRVGTNGNIYINGVRVAQEENFLFSYNITVLSAAIKKALNRERSNVGRTAYSDSVKKILLACSSANTAQLLSEDLKNISMGTNRDELSLGSMSKNMRSRSSTSQANISSSPPWRLCRTQTWWKKPSRADTRSLPSPRTSSTRSNRARIWQGTRFPTSHNSSPTTMTVSSTSLWNPIN